MVASKPLIRQAILRTREEVKTPFDVWNPTGKPSRLLKTAGGNAITRQVVADEALTRLRVLMRLYES